VPFGTCFAIFADLLIHFNMMVDYAVALSLSKKECVSIPLSVASLESYFG